MEKERKYVYVGPIIERLRSLRAATAESLSYQQTPFLEILRQVREVRQELIKSRLNLLFDRLQGLLPSQPQPQPKAQKALEEMSIEELRKILEEKEFSEWMKEKMREEFKRERGYSEEKKKMLLRG